MLLRRLLLTSVFTIATVACSNAEDASTRQMYQRYGNAQGAGAPVTRAAPQISQPVYENTTRTQNDVGGFDHWLHNFRKRAAGQGLQPGFLSSALGGIEYKPRVIELDGKQPENKITFQQYKKNIVSQKRITDGRKYLSQHHALLNRVSKQYGVPPQYIVALWGIETNFGANTGGFDTLSALATLAYEGRRASFFENEFIKALKIMQGGHAGTDRLTGSWAGAMGQCQFMPSSYLRYGADGDGDGNINIWSNLPDVFASTANYLKTEGWNPYLRWGRAVTAPATIADSLYGRETKKPLSYWAAQGVKLPGGKPLPVTRETADLLASLVAPDGPGTETYLVYQNYNVIMHWNRSTYFATSVGLLADAIANGPAR
jgi:membrane-bound lytic murein transglycosylase B